MVTLTDILRNAPIDSDSPILDTGIYEIVETLSKTIDSGLKEGQSRIAAHKNGVTDFFNGFADAFNNVDYQTRTPSYKLGHVRGQSIHDKIKERRESSDAKKVDSYGRLMQQIGEVAKGLLEEFTRLEKAVKKPYEFLLERMNYVIDMGTMLARVFEPYKTLIEDLLASRVTELEVVELESKPEPAMDDNIRLGIIYLFRERVNDAQSQFTQAKDKAQGTVLYNPLRNVYSNILGAYKAFNEAYARLKLAQSFEASTPKKA